MITLPRWFPEIEFRIYLFPLLIVDMAAMRRACNVRYYTITSAHVGVIQWRGAWLWEFGFNLYKRPEIP